MKRTRLPLLVLLGPVAVSLVAGPAAAQDAHYWTETYGPRASLLGGAVIGSVDGFAATYYNPARLSLIEGPGFGLSTQVWQLESITVDDGAGAGVDLGTTRAGLEPSLIAGSLPLGGDDHTWAYSLLARQNVNTDVGTELVFENSDIGLGESLQRAVGVVRFENDIRDSWAGLSWAHQTSARFGLGATMYGALRSQTSRWEGIGQALDTLGTGEADIELAGHNYWTARLVGKLGAFYTLPNLDLGLTVTTPSLQLLGKGTVGASRGRFGDDEGDYLVAGIREGLDATYRSPASVGLGAAWTIKSTRLHWSAEWFGALDPYDVISTGALTLEGDTVQVGVTHGTRSVVNWGIGAEHRFSPRFKGYASLVSDNSAALDEPTTIGTATWDPKTATIGVDFTVSEIRFTLGAGVGWADADLEEVVDFLAMGEGEVLEDAGDARIRFRSWRFIFGFEF
jgi:hypothetical protein